LKKGVFIVLEGLDGSGITTQCLELGKNLSSLGYKVYITGEPTNSVIGCLIRSCLSGWIFFNNKVLALLYAADRLLHVEKIKSKIEEGYIVISGRYLFSSLAYQSIDPEISFEWIKELNKFAIKPDIAIFIDTSIDECLRRINLGKPRKELFEDRSKLEAIRANFERVVREENLIVVDGNRSIQEVAQDIKKIVIDYLTRI